MTADDEVTRPIAVPAAPGDTAVMHLPPAAAHPSPQPPPGGSTRLRDDARAAVDDVCSASIGWLRRGDRAVVVATVAVAVLLLVVVAVVG